MSQINLNSSPIRVVIQQGALPRYRVPVFRELASRPGLDVKVVYGQVPWLGNDQPSGFAGEYAPLRMLRVKGHPFFWHAAQWRFAGRDRADVLILAWDVHYVSLLPALLRAKANGVGTVLWGHGYSKQDSWLRGLPRRTVAELAGALLFYGEGMRQRYLQAGWPAQRVYVARNALDQTPIQQARQQWLGRPADLEAFAQREGLRPGPVAIFISRLEEANRVDWLLEAGAKLRTDYPHLKIVIVGKGPDQPRLETLTRQLNIEHHVRFTGPIYEDRELAPWCLNADVFCYPRNIGLSILHAFGYGLPVVTSDRTEAQNPEIEALTPEQNGLVYADADRDALAGALRRIFDDRELARRLSAEALRTATERFSLPGMVDGFEAAIRYVHGQMTRR